MARSLKETIGNLPDEPALDRLPEIRRLLSQSGRKIVVLDDDPTGTQTVHNTAVLTTWSVDDLIQEFQRNEPLFYVLTNSRALDKDAAVGLAKQIGDNLVQAARVVGCEFTVVSRSDSTLRGHYPAEVDAVASAIGTPDAVQVIFPYFLQGGRYTIDDVHYVAEGDTLVPAADTPFARDATFGFESSNLIDWVVEKRRGDIVAEQVHAIGLEELRRDNVDELATVLQGLPLRHAVIVNAVTMNDVHTFSQAALIAQSKGQKFIYRTAASFVQSFAGLEPQPLLQADAMVNPDANTGLIVVGSYVPKTTTQFRQLMNNADNLVAVELSVKELLGGSSEDHVSAKIAEVNDHLAGGRNVVLHTSRDLVIGDDGDSSLRIGNHVSAAVVRVVRGVRHPLRFLIAKGGITSSDVATKALDVRRAMVLGQILPGIPVWRLQDESRMPDLAYTVFPGNVGGDDALLQAYRKVAHVCDQSWANDRV